MTGGYLSRDRAHLAELQRTRRKYLTRIDYTPGKDALAVIDAKRSTARPGSQAATNSELIDAIVLEWAALTGIKWEEVREQASDLTLARRAAEREAGVFARMSLVRRPPAKSTARVICGARRHRDGAPCQAKSEPGKRRCRFHGGRSTGPRTPEGKARCTANLPNRKWKRPDAGE